MFQEIPTSDMLHLPLQGSWERPPLDTTSNSSLAMLQRLLIATWKECIRNLIRVACYNHVIAQLHTAI